MIFSGYSILQEKLHDAVRFFETCTAKHTLHKDVPKSDFSKEDKRTMSLVPMLLKSGTKGQDNRFIEFLIRDK